MHDNENTSYQHRQVKNEQNGNSSLKSTSKPKRSLKLKNRLVRNTARKFNKYNSQALEVDEIEEEIIEDEQDEIETSNQMNIEVTQENVEKKNL